MKKTFLLGLAIVAIFTACTNNTDTETQTPERIESNPNDPANLVNKLPDAADEAATAEMNRKKEEVTQSVDNITSPYRYITSSEKYSIFGALVKASGVSKHIHSGHVTLLAPSNEAFESFPAYTKLMDPSNIEKLDLFVSNYVLDKSYSYKTLKNESVVSNHAGRQLRVNTDGGVTVDKASIGSEEIYTNDGLILTMNELFYIPEGL
ncbi:MAG: hypothetical protein GC193_11635 [Cryomorphaceae bacterium]|nr:hypothetical protein [Cryomorphaceae bacterium]